MHNLIGSDIGVCVCVCVCVCVYTHPVQLQFLQFFRFITFMSLHTSSNHLIIDLPVCHHHIGFHSNIPFAIRVVSVLCTRPKHLIVWAVINLTMCAPLVKRKSSLLLCIPHVLSPACSGPSIFLRIIFGATARCVPWPPWLFHSTYLCPVLSSTMHSLPRSTIL
jgi:hypothetical protein